MRNEHSQNKKRRGRAGKSLVVASGAKGGGMKGRRRRWVQAIDLRDAIGPDTHANVAYSDALAQLQKRSGKMKTQKFVAIYKSIEVVFWYYFELCLTDKKCVAS